MEFIVYGFPNKVAALQFEWSWQKPHLCRLMRDSAGHLAKKSGLKNKAAIMCALLKSEKWRRYGLSVLCTTELAHNVLYSIESSPAFPHRIGAIDSLPMYNDHEEDDEAEEEEHQSCGGALCGLCDESVSAMYSTRCGFCRYATHITCLADWSLFTRGNGMGLIPLEAHCPSCEVTCNWAEVIRNMSH